MREKRKLKKDLDKEVSSQILRSKACPAFYFFTDIGCYTGKFANSLVDFRNKIENLNVNSVEFHNERGDFQKWLRDCVGDSELANEIGKISKKLKGKELREKIYQAANNRIKELQKMIHLKET